MNIEKNFKVIYLEEHLGMPSSDRQRCSVAKGVLKKIEKFTGKQLCQILFLA